MDVDNTAMFITYQQKLFANSAALSLPYHDSDGLHDMQVVESSIFVMRGVTYGLSKNATEAT
jgi:hypothetical protein